MSNILPVQSLQYRALAALNNRTFHLILFPTEKCNFRCTYCYEDFKIGKMNQSVVKGVKSLLESKFKVVSQLQVEWFGGEPLLALPIVEEISEHIVRLAKANEQVAYNGAMTTNAYLLRPDVFERLVSLGITSYQISLDGDENVHNSTRKTLNGDNGFAVIWRNLVGIHRSKSDVEIILRIHLSKENVGSIEVLLEKIASELGDDARFKVYLRPLEKLGGPNDASLRVLTPDEQERVIEHLLGSVSSKVSVFNESKEESAAKSHICYAAQGNSLAIRADGSIAKCTVALYDEQNRVGRIQEDGKLLIDRNRFMPWLRGLESMNPEELSCPYKGMIH
jgi:uncharacterized protein